MRDLLARVVGALALVAVAAPSALAHGGATLGTDYASVVRSMPPGIEARAIGGDDRIELRRTGSGTYTVVGYVDEPFLRLGPDGVYRNAASISVPLSEDRLPADATARELNERAEEPPRWEKVSDGDSIVYHDHRAHWMSTTPPAVVRDDPGTARTIFDWSIPIDTADGRDRIRGEVRYVPPPTASIWWALLGVAIAAAVAVAVRTRAASLGRIVVAAAVVGTLAGLVVAAAGAWDEPGRLVAVARTCAAPGLIAVAAVGSAAALRRTPPVAALALAGGVLVATLLAVGERIAPSFAYGVVPSALPAVAVRLLVIASLAALALLVVGAGRQLLAALEAPAATADRATPTAA